MPRFSYRILLILADGRINKISLGPFSRSMREAPLTLTTLAALAPKSLDLDFTLVDESVEKVPLDYKADLVGISAITGTSKRAYALADHFRRQGVPVVLGGVHVTLRPDEARKHADSIVIGPAENTWPSLLLDFSNGNLKPVYKDDNGPGNTYLEVPTPRRELQRSLRYMVPNTVMATRGCKGNCDFCTVPAVFKGYSKRPVDKVIADIRDLPGKLMVFNDVSLADDLEYAKELFTAMIPLKKRWGGLATVRIAKDPELVRLMAESGCRYVLVGFESVDQSALRGISKGFNKQKEYTEFMDIMHSYGISVQGCFIFGFDEDEKTVFEATVQSVIQMKVDIPRYAILTPYPETSLFKRLETEKRILTYDWQYYDTMHVVFAPKQMTAEELYKGYKRAYQETFTIPHIARRLSSFSFSSMINFIGNLTYRRLSRRLPDAVDPAVLSTVDAK